MPGAPWRESAAACEPAARLFRRLPALALAVTLFGVQAAAMDRPPPPESSPDRQAETVPVLFVADGDTVRVRRAGRRQWVRLLRIDTPERDEEGYTEARSRLLELIDGRPVSLVFERPGVEARDEHGRLLAYLFVGSTNVNVEMVRSGWSTFWTRYGKGRFAADFRRAESEAKRARRGLWGRRRSDGSQCGRGRQAEACATGGSVDTCGDYDKISNIRRYRSISAPREEVDVNGNPQKNQGSTCQSG